MASAVGQLPDDLFAAIVDAAVEDATKTNTITQAGSATPTGGAGGSASGYGFSNGGGGAAAGGGAGAVGGCVGGVPNRMDLLGAPGSRVTRTLSVNVTALLAASNASAAASASGIGALAAERSGVPAGASTSMGLAGTGGSSPSGKPTLSTGAVGAAVGSGSDRSSAASGKRAPLPSMRDLVPPLDSSELVNINISPLGADEFFPIFVFVVCRANLVQPLHLKEFLWLAADSQDLRGQGGYWLTVFEAAMSYIRSARV